MPIIHDGQVKVFQVPNMGPYNNNGYVLADPISTECYLVDAPAEIGRLFKEATGLKIKGVLLTHTHPDHIAGYSDLKQFYDVEIGVHSNDTHKLPDAPGFTLSHNQLLKLGETIQIRVLHTPGHTVGSICLSMPNCLVSGDTLFPGGPGYTRSADEFQEIVTSITGLFETLPDETLVLPGHGNVTTIGTCKNEYSVFSGKDHPEDLFGHINWLNS